MSRNRFFPGVWSSALLLTGALSITLLGGCPQQQVPRTPNNNDNSSQNPPPPGQDDDDDIPRPIPPPPVDDGGDDSGGSDDGGGGDDSGGGSDGGSSGGGDDGSGGSSASVQVLGPTRDTVTRAKSGSSVEIRFRVRDNSGAITSLDVVLARDDNGDGKADGDPVYSEGIVFSAGENAFPLLTTKVKNLIQNGASRFLIGVRYRTSLGTNLLYALGKVTIDDQAPIGQLIAPLTSELVSRGAVWSVTVQSSDTSKRTIRVLLDRDTEPRSGNEFELVPATEVAQAGVINRVFNNLSLATLPSAVFYYYLIISDGVEPATEFYGVNPANGELPQIAVTNRLVGTFDINNLADSSQGAIFQGFNPNDQAGSAMTALPDIDGDGDDEVVIVSRFAKPYNITTAPGTNGVGFGESYMIYGRGQRYRGIRPLNAVGGGNISGLAFAGIRTPINADATPNASVGWTYGISDVTVVPDMDGDEDPELVFSFPRVESISLVEEDPRVAHPDLVPDGSVGGLGNLEYNALHAPPAARQWFKDEAQFTRGGVVIISSHNEILQNPSLTNRKDDRIIDLHEVGQLFTDMGLPPIVAYIDSVAPGFPAFGAEDCDGDGEADLMWTLYGLYWDVAFSNQGPGGFHQTWTVPSASPPLANARPWPFVPLPPWAFYDHCIPGDPICDLCMGDFDGDGEPDECQWVSGWLPWLPILPGTTGPSSSWIKGSASAWTGFYGYGTPNVAIREHSIGARILGQAVNDNFGTTIGSDGKFLYIAAPNRTPNGAPYTNDVPLLTTSRPGAGVVYQLRTNSKPNGSPYTLTQLWLEPGTRTELDPNAPDPNDPNAIIVTPLAWPYLDKELPNRSDTTIPVPHQYLIESVGSSRPAVDRSGISRRFATDDDECPFPYYGDEDEGLPMTGDNAAAARTPDKYPVGGGGYYVDRTAQIVGPHANAHISFVRGLGDFDGDGIRDVAIGSDQIKQNVLNGTGDTVGAIFLVASRSTGLGGDILLEEFAKPEDQRNLTGVLLRGANTGEKLARVIDNAGDFNGDGYDDVIVGSEGADIGGNVDAGEVIVIFGSPTLNSPAGGWTVADLVTLGRAVRFTGVGAGDLAGANVAGAGDVDADGLTDILLAAPGAEGTKGVVYLIYGSPNLTGTISLASVGSVNVQGVRFVGRVAGDRLGGGSKTVNNTDPSGGSTLSVSRGIAAMGDIDRDGRGDYAISSILADPLGRSDAGEVYLLYGRGD
jgi:hypothetical protein